MGMRESTTEAKWVISHVGTRAMGLAQVPYIVTFYVSTLLTYRTVPTFRCSTVPVH